jgi:hypothetical protein
MPPDTTLRTFIAAVRTRSTKTTKALDNLFADPGSHRGTPIEANLNPQNALDTGRGAWGSGGWARGELLGRGLTAAEVDHLQDWPNPEKRKVRSALVAAIRDDRTVHFFWELHDGTNSETVIDPPNLQGTGPITVTFRSPWAKVSVKGVAAGQADDVIVAVP